MLLPLRDTYRYLLKVTLLVLFAGLAVAEAQAQCVRIKDPKNSFLPTFSPRKNFACLTASSPRNASVLRIDFEAAVRNVSIDWGDGSAPQAVPGPVNFVTYTYPDTGTYTYSITQQNCSTVIQGKFIVNFNTSTPGVGFVFPPAGTDNRRCLPTTLGIRNLSPGMNSFTEFIIDWGGQEKRDTVDRYSYDQIINHTYKPGSKICRTRMTVSYRNICGAVPGQQPLTQSAGDYYFVEKDSAMATPMKVVMCGPTTVLINDASKLNCLDTSGRKIAWQASRGFATAPTMPGNGGFVTYNNVANKRVTIPASAFTPAPADSTYKIQLFLRNLCGTDTAEIEVFMAQPKKPVLGLVNNNTCPGEPVSFTNGTQSQYPDGVLQYEWDFGDGSAVLVSNDPVVEHIFQVGGTYNVKLTCRVLTTVTGQACTKFSTVTVNVKRNVTPLMKITPNEVCNSGVVTIKNKSVNTQNVTWTGWQLNNQPVWNGGSGFLPVMQNGQDTSVVALRSTNVFDSTVTVAYKRYGRYIVSLSAQSAGCPQFVRQDTLDIYPKATIRWRPMVRKVCVGTPFNIRDSSIVFATDSNGLPRTFRNLTWMISMGDTTHYRSSAPVSANFDSPVLSNRITSHTYRAPGIYKVALTVWVGKKNCPVTDTILIQALPAPTPTFGFIRNRCDNQRVRFTNTTTDSATFFSYEVRRGTVLAARYVRTDRQPFDVQLPYVPPGDSTYYQVTLKAFMVTGNDTCLSLSAAKRVSIAPTPVAAFSASQTDGCSPMLGVTFNNASFNMAIDTSNRFYWNFGNGQTSTLENPLPQTYNNNSLVLKKDTVLFRVTRRDGCVFESSREIFIFPAPNVVMSAPDSICSGVPAALSATGNNLSQFTWSFPDYDQSNTFDPTPLKTFTNYTNQAKVFTIELNARTIYNCPQFVSKQIKIFPQPQVDIATAPQADNHCSPMQVRFNYANVSGASSFKWYFGNGDSALYTADTSFTRTFTNPSSTPLNNTVRLVASNGGRCSTSVSRSITVNPEVRASFTANSMEGCHPLFLVANNTSTIGGDNLTWKLGSQIIQNQVSLQQTLANISAERDTTVTLQLIVRNTLAPFCRDTATKRILVHPKPRLDGISTTSATGCSPLLSALVATGAGIKTYNWNFGDGDQATDTTGRQTHTYENYNPTADRYYTAQVVASNQFGCTDTSSRVMTVKPFTQAGIVSQDTMGCSPYTVRFSSAGSVNANRFDWTFGSQATSNVTNPIVTLINNSDTAQTIMVRLVAQKTQVTGCPDTAYRTVVVFPKPEADFSLSARIGCGPLAVQIRNQSRLAASSYWIISSGGVSDTIRNRPTGLDTTFSNPNLVNKTVQIDLVVTSANGCVSTKRDFVTVYADVTAKFELEQEGCHPHLATIVNRSSNNGGSWLWNFGDGNTATTRNPQHVFSYTRSARDTTYWVKLTSVSAIGGCSRTDSVPVKVHGRPSNNFNISSPANRRLQLPSNQLTIQNRTAYYPQWHYKWSFGDGTTDTTRAGSFTHRYNFTNQDFTDTNFVITQIAYSDYGCSDTLRESMIIQPEPPIPAFTYADSVGCSPLSVAFYNRSTYGREYLWDFGDRGISDEKNPVHIYTKAGKYTVSLTVSGFGGTRTVKRDTVIEVQAFGSALFTSNPLPGMEVVIPEQSVQFQPLYPCPTCTYLWDFGDGTTSTEASPSHLYKEAKTWNVALKVISSNGCMSADTVEDAVLTVDKRVVNAPNAFAPSKNGPNGGYLTNSISKNAIFYPFTQGVTAIRLRIFNRWGELMYQSTELNRGWDGYINGIIAPMDTYIYQIEATFATGERRTKMGDVTLLH